MLRRKANKFKVNISVNGTCIYTHATSSGNIAKIKLKTFLMLLTFLMLTASSSRARSQKQLTDKAVHCSVTYGY